MPRNPLERATAKFSTTTTARPWASYIDYAVRLQSNSSSSSAARQVWARAARNRNIQLAFRSHAAKTHAAATDAVTTHTTTSMIGG
jgi:hypothetical protein